MTTYNIISNESRWSMSMLVFDTKATTNSIPQPTLDVDPSHATQLTKEIMEKMATEHWKKATGVFFMFIVIPVDLECQTNIDSATKVEADAKARVEYI